MYQPVSIGINRNQPESTRINLYQPVSIGINQNKHVSTLINPYQSESTRISFASYVGSCLFDKKEPKGGMLKGLRRQGRRGLWVSKFQHPKLGPLWVHCKKKIIKLGKNQKKHWPAQKWPPPLVTG